MSTEVRVDTTFSALPAAENGDTDQVTEEGWT
jgi:hypothetical protein